MTAQSFSERIERLKRRDRMEVEAWAFPAPQPKPKRPILPPLTVGQQVRLAPFWMPVGVVGIFLVRAYQDMGGALAGNFAHILWAAIVLFHVGLMSAISAVFFDGPAKPRTEWKLLHVLAGYAFGGAMLSLTGFLP
jgi:hypothetical protein